MTSLAHTLGLNQKLSFHDIYSLTDPDLLSFIPRPCLALLVTIPMTPTWDAARQAEDSSKAEYQGSGPSEPSLWFKQTIEHACGSIGLIHCLLNGEVREHIAKGSTLDEIYKAALPLNMMERAKVLEDSEALEKAHQEAAQLGDTEAPGSEEAHRLGNHFVAFVKGTDGHLYELEGGRKGPLDRGLLKDDEDLLSERALELGLGRLIKIERENEGGGNLRFSCTALAPSLD